MSVNQIAGAFLRQRVAVMEWVKTATHIGR